MWREFLEQEGIFCARELRRDALRIVSEARFRRIEERIGRVESAVVFLIPYYAGQQTTNLSVYAQPRDYHLYIRILAERFGDFLEQKGSDLGFCALADSSPIDERDAALKAGLGIRGKNGLVISERYGSYFFIGELFLNRPVCPSEPVSPRSCPDCGACRRACPTGAILDPKREECLSLITQKKRLTPREEELLSRATCKWGCDLCQSSCPYNEKAEETPIPFFREAHVTQLTEEVVESDKAEFLTRAFSWRGRDVLRRNLKK
ncbi:MAG: 4Fe-4S binding protein [Clostridia bacterium]|nr:4Fe-4S binding protein [Clostridia bacterium]